MAVASAPSRSPAAAARSSGAWHCPAGTGGAGVSRCAGRGTTGAEKRGKDLNNIVKQDHRAVKRITRPMLGFKFAAAQPTLVGIELMNMIRKGQLEEGSEQGLAPAEQFYSLAT
jgi:transposase-like protein